MSAASPATPQVRRHAAAAPSRAPQQQARPAAQSFSFASPDSDDEIRIHLGDIPRMQESLEVEAFKPSLLSRLFDLIAPYRQAR